jgi:hypothetical protein
MMNFRKIKDSIIQLLGSNANNRFQTLGYQRQNKNAAEVLGVLRTAQVYYWAGDFPKDKSSQYGPFQHGATFRIELTAASDAQGDLATIKSGGSSLQQKANALLAFQSASFLCDCSIDEFSDIIFQILMDARNEDLGMPGQVSNRWINRIEKDDIEDRGEYVVLTASMDFSLNTEEQILGDTSGISNGLDYGVTLDIEGDDTEQTGVKGTLGGE